MKKSFLAAVGAAVLALLIAACGGGGGGGGGGGDGGGGGIGGTGVGSGTMRFSLTDAPACGYDEVNVTIEKIRVHQSATAQDADSGWSEVVLNPARRVDLLTLTNGVLDELGQTQLPAGKYTQLRLVLAANDASHPFANSIVLSSSGSEVALDTPSAQQSGLKLNADIDVPAGKIVDVVLDFDACKSVVKRGNSGRYNLKPVIAVTPVLSDDGMRIEGWVDPALDPATTNVSVQFQDVQGPRVVKATQPDGNGRFILYPVPAGTYTLVVSAEGRVTAVMTGVPANDSSITQVNSIQVPIVPAVDPLAPLHFSGTVNPATATVRALQSLTGGPTIEVSSAPVDALTGDYAFTLAAGVPQKTSFVPNPTSIVFTSDPAAAGKYTLQAQSAGVAKSVNVNATTVSPINFVFP